MNIVNLIAIVSTAIVLFNVAVDESRPVSIRQLATVGTTCFWTALLLFSTIAVATLFVD